MEFAKNSDKGHGYFLKSTCDIGECQLRVSIVSADGNRDGHQARSSRCLPLQVDHEIVIQNRTASNSRLYGAGIIGLNLIKLGRLVGSVRADRQKRASRRVYL